LLFIDFYLHLGCQRHHTFNSGWLGIQKFCFHNFLMISLERQPLAGLTALFLIVSRFEVMCLLGLLTSVNFRNIYISTPAQQYIGGWLPILCRSLNMTLRPTEFDIKVLSIARDSYLFCLLCRSFLPTCGELPICGVIINPEVSNGMSTTLQC
jgi:hypothetical protein